MEPYYSENGITIFHGDCLEVADGLESDSVNLILTDPPYSSGTRREGAKGVRKSMNRETADDAWFGTDCLTTNGFLWLMRGCAREWRRLLKPHSHILSFIDWRMNPALAGAIETADLRQSGVVVWDKMMIGMGACFRNQHEFILHFTYGVGREPFRRDCPNVLRYPAIRGGLHDCEKPVDLLSKLIEVTTDAGETVCDFFAGSGSTLVAAKAVGRCAIGIESEERYCEIAANRLRQGVLFGSEVA
ncbi:MAG TPA: site-specific DNA-methyltransferase [Tepidisphaeraceae bacterium]|jgi:site-specific DNA-methyltransferase (adenine-specific)|nr:site-specific DNA-methyltransferase [Tepidisphaeraceae bacterium]